MQAATRVHVLDCLLWAKMTGLCQPCSYQQSVLECSEGLGLQLPDLATNKMSD